MYMTNMKIVRKGGGPEKGGGGGGFRGDIYTLFISELIDWTLWKRVNKRKI